MREDRSEAGNGGGCLLYYKECLDVNSNLKLLSQRTATLEININLHSHRILVSVMYRPPKQRPPSMMNLKSSLKRLRPEGKVILVIGDLNADLTDRGPNGTMVQK